MCKHIVVESCFIYELYALERFQTAKVTFKLTQDHSQICRSMGHIWFPIYLHCNCVSIYCLFSKIWRRHMTVTKHIHGTVCSPNAKASHGKRCTKFEVSSHSREFLEGTKNLNESCDYNMPVWGGVIFHSFGKTWLASVGWDYLWSTCVPSLK